jgi:predicted ATPase/DNA-binding SARP family transcriptional activator/Tfp pilus assembly protein PilF
VPESNSGNLTVGLLGPVVLFADGAPSPSRSAGLRTFLALVGLNPGQHISAAAIAEELWGDALPKDPRAALHVHATRLRRWLESAGVPSAALRFDHDSHVLDIEPNAVDAVRFGDAAQHGDIDALALWRGEPFGGCAPRALLDIEAGRLHELRLQLLEARVDALLAAGHHDVAVVETQALFAAHPEREHIAATAMLALYRDGRQHDALGIYQAHRSHVIDEYGLDPSKELAALEARILEQDETLLTSLVPVDESRIGTRPQPHNLRAPVTSFIGRQDELAQLQAMVIDGARLITITGAGGIGKTRLALEAGRSLLERFGSGTWFVDLAPVSDPSAITDAIAAALDTQEPEEKLSAGPTLLVLDNLEHLLSGVVAIAELLARCPDLVVLATSRERLRLQGEHDLELAGLPSDAAAALFSARAGSANRPVARDENVDALCARVDGMPLAIELAAARLRTQSIEQLLTALDAMLDVLDEGERDRPERHQAMRAAIAVSVTGLTVPERSVFRAFSVFAGGATAEALAEVCRPKGDEVRSLVDKSLLRADGTGRFTMLEPIRQYAAELLAYDELGELEERVAAHADYFLALAEEAEPHLITARQHEWMDVLAADHANLRLAWERGEGDTPLRVAAALVRFWASRNPTEGRAVLTRVLVSDGDIGATARALLGAAHLAILQGDLDAATPLLARALELDDPRTTATAHNLLGEVARISGDLDEAERHYELALAGATALGDDRLVALATNNQAIAKLNRGDLHAARVLWQLALAAADTLGDQPTTIRILTNLGWVYRELGTPTAAAETLQRSVDLARACGDRGAEANSLLHLAGALREAATAGDAFPELEAHVRDAIEIYDELGLRRELAAALLSVPALTDDVEKQLAAIARARSLFLDLGDVAGVEDADTLRESVLTHSR